MPLSHYLEWTSLCNKVVAWVISLISLWWLRTSICIPGRRKKEENNCQARNGIQQLHNSNRNRGTMFSSNIFTPFECCSFEDTRVIINVEMYPSILDYIISRLRVNKYLQLTTETNGLACGFTNCICILRKILQWKVIKVLIYCSAEGIKLPIYFLWEVF